MALKTYKEFKNKKLEVEKSTSTIIDEKEEKEKIEKLYHLRHPDYPFVIEGTYKMEMDNEIDLEIKDGVIITEDEEVKNKLVNNGFHYLGYKIDGKPFI